MRLSADMYIITFMKTPSRLQPLVFANMIDEVVGQLQSGKEAEVYVVKAKGEVLCAKVYKLANDRSFKHRTQYTEGRKVKNSRKARAMDGKSRYGRQERESEWQNTEVDALYLLGAAGVRVPKTLGFLDGVLLMQMITDEEGLPAPRLIDYEMTLGQAREFHQILMREVVRMLCAGYVHGDLSEFNILIAKDGPVIIDLPQAVQATSNTASGILERDLNHLARFFGRVAPEIAQTQYAKEIWALFQSGKLKPDSPLSGTFKTAYHRVNVRGVLAEIEDAEKEEKLKRGLK